MKQKLFALARSPLGLLLLLAFVLRTYLWCHSSGPDAFASIVFALGFWHLARLLVASVLWAWRACVALVARRTANDRYMEYHLN